MTSPEITDALLPCPFCGETKLKTGGDDKIVGTWCLTCEASGPNEYGKFGWNHRAALAAGAKNRTADAAGPRPWTAEANLPYGEQPRIYDASGRLVAVVGNAEIDRQDEWEGNAELIVAAVNGAALAAGVAPGVKVNEANAEAEYTGALMQGLYVRDGTPMVAEPGEPVAWEQRHRENSGEWSKWYPTSKKAFDLIGTEPDGSLQARPLYAAPPARQDGALREALAQMMLRQGLATGHGDSFDDLLREAEWQIAERSARYSNLLTTWSESRERHLTAEAELTRTRDVLASTGVGSLPHDYPTSKMAEDRMRTLNERTLEGLALIGKIEALEAALAQSAAPVQPQRREAVKHARSDYARIQDTTDAVALAELVLSMGMVTEPGKYARHLARKVLGIHDVFDRPDEVAVTTNGTTRIIPADEPVFLIRGQDAVGGDAVRAWADLAEANGARADILAVARDHAAKMDAWPKKKTPDLAPPVQQAAPSGEGE